MLILSLILLIALCIWIFNLNSNLLHPTKAYPYFILIYVLPFSLLYLFKGDSILTEHSLIVLKGQSDSVMTHFVFLNIITLIFYTMGVNIASRVYIKRNNIQKKWTNSEIKKLKGTAIIMFMSGFLIFVYYYQSIGGFDFYLNNLARRSTITSGSGYLSAVYRFLNLFSSCLLLISFKQNTIKKSTFFTIIAISILMLLISGSRSIVIRYVMIVTSFAYLLYRPNLKSIFTYKNIFLASIFLSLIIIYTLAVPIIRRSTLEGKINIHESIQESMNDFESIAKGNLYTEIQLNILNLFNKSNYWQGRTYLDLLMIPIPRSIMPSKPSADDGIYIYNCVYFNKVIPIDNMHFGGDLIVQSWPPHTFGAAYANFGITGLLFSYLLLGMIISLVYKKMNNSNLKIIYCFIYLYAFFRFQLSNLLIIETMTIVILISFSSILFPIIRKQNIYTTGVANFTGTRG